MADFIAEFAQLEDEKKVVAQWSVHTNGSSNRKAGGAGVVIQTPEGDKVECMI